MHHTRYQVGLGLVRCHSGVHLVVGINSVCMLRLVCSLCLLMCRVLHHKFSPVYVLLFTTWRYCDVTDIEVVWSDRHWSYCALTDIEVVVIWQTLKLLCSDRHWSCCDLTDIEVTVLWQMLWQTLKLLCSDRHCSCCDLTDIEVTLLWQTLKLLCPDRHRSYCTLTDTEVGCAFGFPYKIKIEGMDMKRPFCQNVWPLVSELN